jgi:hypothetical protein
MTADALDPLSRLLAERACERLIIDFVHRLDLGEPGSVADLFTADGIWEWPDGDRRIEGWDALRRYFGSRPADRLSRRMMTNIRRCGAQVGRHHGGQFRQPGRQHPEQDARVRDEVTVTDKTGGMLGAGFTVTIATKTGPRTSVTPPCGGAPPRRRFSPVDCGRVSSSLVSITSLSDATPALVLH